MAKNKPSSYQTTSFAQRGLKAFHKNDFATAIHWWEQANTQAPSPGTKSALAEAYFRQGLETKQAGFIQKAIELQPNEPRFVYHLGLAAYRQGRVKEAMAAYQKVWQMDSEWQRRVAYPMALAYVAMGEDVTQTAVWPRLSPAEQTLLEQSQAVLRHQSPAAENPLWQGISDYQNGRFAAAQTQLTQAATYLPTKGISHYYLGSIAAQQSNWETARHHWLLSYKAGYRSPNLQTNLGELFHRLAEQLMAQNELPQALAAATEAYQHKTDDKTLNDLISTIEQQMAYEAAQKGDWKTAEKHWKVAETKAGGSFRLAYNLALVYEQQLNYHLAAEQWREALRRRPRRADHPDTINDEQVSRLWQRVAEAYAKEDDFDESIQVYKQAVKWQPDNLTLRLALADGLLNNGRLQAAENELQRILQKDPNHIPALLRMGEVIYQSHYWWQNQAAVHYWERVIALEPQNQIALQSLSEYYQGQAKEHMNWQGDHQRAIQLYEKALSYQPKDTDTLVSLGYHYLQVKNREKGLACFAQAIQVQPQNPTVYLHIIIQWYRIGDFEAGWQTLLEAEKNIPNLDTPFYAQMAQNSLENQEQTLAQQWIDRAIERASPDTPVYIILGQALEVVKGGETLARTYLQKAIEIGQEVGQAHLLLALLAGRLGDRREMEKEFKTAEKIARQTKDSALAERIRQARNFLSNPFAFLARHFGNGRNLPDILADLLNEEF